MQGSTNIGKLEKICNLNAVRQRPAQRGPHDRSFKSFLNRAHTNYTEICAFCAFKQIAKPLSHFLDTLALQCHRNGNAQNLAHSVSLEFFQSLQSRWLKQGDENWLAHLMTMAPNRLVATNARPLCCRLTESLEPTLNELLQAMSAETKPVLKLNIIKALQLRSNVHRLWNQKCEQRSRNFSC